MSSGKGRCDLMPLCVIAAIVPNKGVTTVDRILASIGEYQKYGQVGFLYNAVRFVIEDVFIGAWDAMLQLAVHFEDGCVKYGERNWEKGIETKSYVDSAVRHYLKWRRGDRDEAHDRACLWNLVCAIWTIENKPELNSYTNGCAVESEEK